MLNMIHWSLMHSSLVHTFPIILKLNIFPIEKRAFLNKWTFPTRMYSKDTAHDAKKLDATYSRSVDEVPS